MTATLPVYKQFLTPLAFLERSARVYPDKIAVVYRDRRYTYREFEARVNRLASALRARGLQKGDRVAFLCCNLPAMLEAHFAVMLAGGVLVCINYRLSPQEVEYILDHSGSRFLFLDTEFTSCVRKSRDRLHALKEIVIIVDVEDGPLLEGEEFEAFLEHGSPDPVPWVIEDEDELISINYTSGTTGRPKGVMFTHRGAYLNAINEALEVGLGPKSNYLWTLPMFHCNGWCFTWAVTAVGGRHVCLRKFDPRAAWEHIREERITHLNGAPVVLIAMLNDPARPRVLHTPLTVTTAGAPPSPTLIEHMQELGAHVVHVYGLTETYGPTTVCAEQADWDGLWSDDVARLMARQGMEYIMSDRVRVVDEAMNDVPADGQTMGEVVMRGNFVMKGYYNDPEATEEAFRGGWFHSGDLAVQHPDGYIELRDRSKDVIISGGENISSIEIEQVLYRHDAVLEAAVIGVPHAKWGESPKAFVTLKNGNQLAEHDLIEFCREHIAHFKCPTSVEFCELPKTSTGKIQKFVLREREWSGHDKRIQG